MNLENNNLLELIYLFADGEASSKETTALFSAIGDKPELQQELFIAMKMRYSVEREFETLALPTSIETTLFEKAGFDKAVPVGNVFHFWGSNLTRVLNYVVIPLISAIMGALMVFFMEKPMNFEPKVTYAGKLTKTDQPTQGTLFNGKIRNNAAPAIVQNYPPKLNRVNRSEQNRTNQLTQKNRQNEGYHLASLSSFEVSGESATNSFMITDFRKYGFDNILSALNTINHDTSDVSVSKFWENLSVELSGYGNLHLFPNRTVVGTPDEMNNLSLSIFYKIGNGQQIGVEGGEETFPIYVANDGRLEYKPTIKWLGIAYKYEPYDILKNVLVTYTKIFVGGNGENPIIKGSIGVYWRPSDKISLGLGLDATELLYYYNNDWSAGQKLGLKYSIEIFY